MIIMKFTKLTLAFGTLALAAAMAAPNTYNIKLDDAAWVGSTQLKAGDYKIQVEGDKAVIKSGKKDVAEVPVKVEQSEKKFPSSEVFMHSDNHKNQIEEFRIGGTTTRIVVQGSHPTGE